VKALTPLMSIPVPPPRPDETYTTRCFDQDVSFVGLKRLLGAADVSKAGDRNAGLAAASETQREAARAILSDLTLRHLYDHPLTDDAGAVDSVMRVNYDIDLEVFDSIADLTIGQLKDRLLRGQTGMSVPPGFGQTGMFVPPGFGQTGMSVPPVRGPVSVASVEATSSASRIGTALTGVMAAAVAKLCDVHELILIARKITCPTKARTRLGMPGTLASRLQPNHPTDDLRGITLLTRWGLSLGAGDALIGVNPAVDTVDNVCALLAHLDRIRRAAGAPTQICVLAHIRTQLACLERGAPVEILFQSLAGTERTNRLEFDITVDLLDLGCRTMAQRGPLRGEADQFMYFETGQGSEFSYGKHNGIDMTTAEALCYGLARRYDPFMVNNVTGFIGPETHLDGLEMILANLQDHFMGKLLGLPMGMAPCFTLHSDITLEGQQIATQLLAAAGANYYMDVGLNTDRMLAYFDTSAHDDQTLREIHDKRPCPEFLEWGVQRGIFARESDGSIVRGPQWGDPKPFCDSEAEFQELLAATPAFYGLDNAGPRPANSVSRRTRLNQSVGREAIHAELRVEELRRLAPFRVVHTQAETRQAHLGSPDRGARLAQYSADTLDPDHKPVQILVSDGLSAEAVHHNVPVLLPLLLDGLADRGIGVGVPLLARHGRVKLAEQLADLLDADLIIHLIGERPGGDAQAARSLSAYLVYRVAPAPREPNRGKETGRFECTVISNIHAGGLAPAQAAEAIVEKSIAILTHKAAGNRLESMRGELPD